MNISPEQLTQIKKQLAKESEPDNPLDRALESAEIIRSNIKAIKGERYLRLVEIGVLIHKATEVNATLAHAAFEDNEDQIRIIGTISSSVLSQVINHCCRLFNEEFETKEAVELLEWVDRVFNAEKAGIEKEFSHLTGND